MNLVSSKKRKSGQQQVKRADKAPTLSDSLNDDILAKLKAAKKELTEIEHEKEKQQKEEIRRERKEREDNKSFEELLNQYGGLDSKKN